MKDKNKFEFLTAEFTFYFLQNLEFDCYIYATCTVRVREYYILNCLFSDFFSSGIVGTLLLLILIIILIVFSKQIRISIAIIQEASK